MDGNLQQTAKTSGAAAINVLPRKKTGLRLVLATAGLALVIAGGLYGADRYSATRFLENTNDAYVGGEITVIAPKIPGLITEVAVTDNQQVHAGDLLVRLDDRDYKAALAFAEASVSAQAAAVDNIAAKRELQQSLIAQAKAEVSGVAAELSRAQKDERRNFSLAHTAAVSGQTLDHVAADLQKAEAASSRAKAALEAAQNEIAVLDTQKKQAEAALKQSEAQRDIAKLNLSYTELRAPTDGVVGNRAAKQGSYAATGAQLISLVPSQGLWVDANFKENQLEHMHPGQIAHVVADVAPGRVFKGRVESLSPATGAQFSILPPENATGNFTKIVQRVPVRIALEGVDAALGLLRPGLSVSVTVDQQQQAKTGEGHDELSLR